MCGAGEHGPKPPPEKYLGLFEDADGKLSGPYMVSDNGDGTFTVSRRGLPLGAVAWDDELDLRTTRVVRVTEEDITP